MPIASLLFLLNPVSFCALVFWWLESFIPYYQDFPCVIFPFRKNSLIIVILYY